MFLKLDTVITNIAGTPLPWGEDTKEGDKVVAVAPSMTLGDVLLNTALGRPANGEAYTARQTLTHWRLAQAVFKVKTESRPPHGDIPTVELLAMRDDIARGWPVHIAGQVLALLDEAQRPARAPSAGRAVVTRRRRG